MSDFSNDSLILNLPGKEIDSADKLSDKGGSRPPFGYRKIQFRNGDRTRNKLEPEPGSSVAVRVVRRMFDMAMKDTGCKEIAKTLNREGFRTGNSERRRRTTVHKVLTNEAYCGTLVWGGKSGHPAIHSGEPPVRVENA